MEERQRHQNFSGQLRSSQPTVDAEILEEVQLFSLSIVLEFGGLQTFQAHMRMPTTSSRHLQGGVQTPAEYHEEEDNRYYNNVLLKVKFGGTTAAIPRQPVVSPANLPGTTNSNVTDCSNAFGVSNARGRSESSEEMTGFWPVLGSQGRGRFFTK